MKTLAEFKQFVEEINLENGRNYKISILEKYKDNDNVKYYLHYLFNPYIVTGISDKKINKKFNMSAKTNADWKNPYELPSFKSLLEYLKVNNTGRDYDILTAQIWEDAAFYEAGELLYSVAAPDVWHKFFNDMVTKNIQLGIDSKTINKVIPGLIPTFNVMLANKYFDKPEIIEGKEFAITTKIDGMRCIMLKESGNVTFWSRQGQKIDGLVDLEEEAKYFPDNLCLDGELIADVGNPDTYKDTMKRARNKDAEKHGLKMMVFDCMSAEEFRNQRANNAYHKRRDLLDCVFNGTWFVHDFKYFEKLPILYQGTDTSKIIELLEEQTSKGEEGVMINVCDAAYEFKRTNQLLKVKKFQDTEVKVIGFQEGTNKYTGTLGALVCEYKYSTVDVGSGFSDALRDEIWANKDAWMGKIITVKYFEETCNSATGLPSLRFPVFIRVREDA